MITTNGSMEQALENPALTEAAKVLSDPSLETTFIGLRRSTLRSISTLLLVVALPIAVSYASVSFLDRASVFHEVGAWNTSGPVTIDAVPVQAQAQQPLHPLLKVGLNADGRLSIPMLFSAWSNAGLDEDGAKMMLVALYEHGPTFNATRITQNGKVGPSSDTFVSGEDISTVFEKLGGDLSLAVPGQVPQWPAALETWRSLIDMESFDDDRFYDDSLSATPEQASAEIRLAIEEAGLASLTLPLSTQANPNRMMAYATAIRQINQDLGQTTGWGGQALGLAGRVHLRMGQPMGNVDGKTWQEDGQVMIHSNWHALSHEWIHAVDWTLSSHAFANPSIYFVASEQMGLLRRKSGNGSAQAHQDLISGLKDSAPEWTQSLDRLDRQTDRKYYSTTPEILSRSFEAHLVHRISNGQSSPDVGALDSLAYPDHAQSAQQARLWSNWFAHLKPLGLTTPVDQPVSQYTDFGKMLSRHRQGEAIIGAAATQGVAMVEPDHSSPSSIPPRPRH